MKPALPVTRMRWVDMEWLYMTAGEECAGRCGRHCRATATGRQALRRPLAPIDLQRRWIMSSYPHRRKLKAAMVSDRWTTYAPMDSRLRGYDDGASAGHSPAWRTES